MRNTFFYMEELDIKSRLSNNLKNIRKEKGLSQFELAEKANISEQTIISIESKRLWPSDKTLSKITNALEIDIFKLFFSRKRFRISLKRIRRRLKSFCSSKY